MKQEARVGHPPVPPESDTDYFKRPLHRKSTAVARLLLAVIIGALYGGAAAQTSPSRGSSRCQSLCLQLQQVPTSKNPYAVEVYIQNRSARDLRVSDLGFALILRESHDRTAYYSPVNVELGMPISPLPSGAFPESSLLLRPRQSRRWRFDMTGLYWTKEGSPIRYGDWESTISDGSYRLRAEAIGGSKKVSSNWLLFSKKAQ